MTKQTNQPINESELKFALPANNEFPTELFQGMTFQQIAELLGKDFIVLQDKQVFATRIMSDDEISEVRAEYGEIAEMQLPVLRNEMDDINAEYKQNKERITSEITALKNKFLDLVALAREGVREYEPIADYTFRIPISSHYLTYTYTGTKFQLARVQRIPDSERYDLFNSSDRNKEMFKSLGYEFPDITIENRQNYRVIGDPKSGEWIEVWEKDEMDIGYKHFKEDLLDDDKDEIVTIDRKERIEIPISESPYQNEQIET